MTKHSKTRRLTTQVAIDAATKFPNISNKALGEYLFEKYSAIFMSAESARSTVRFITGKLSKEYTMKYGARVNKTSIHTRENPYGLPDSECKKRQFKRIPARFDKILWMGDIHLPNHDIEAVSAAIWKGKEQEVNCIVLGGDILDNVPFTNHDAPLPNYGDVRKWFDMCKDFLLILKKEFPECKFYWLEGNHDLWYARYLMKKAPAIFGDEFYSLPNRLGLDKLGVEYLEQHIILQAGKLHMLHGHTLIRGFMAPVNSARGLFLRTKSSTLIGHVHNSSYHPESNLKGEKIGCWSVGCLCTLAPDYDPHNTKHNQGFAIVTTAENGKFHVQNYTIHEGEIL